MKMVYWKKTHHNFWTAQVYGVEAFIDGNSGDAMEFYWTVKCGPFYAEGQTFFFDSTKKAATQAIDRFLKAKVTLQKMIDLLKDKNLDLRPVEELLK